MRPRTHRDGRNHSGLRATRRRFGTARHIGERPEGRGTNGTPSVYPRWFLLGRIRGHAGSYWPGPDDIAAVHSRPNDHLAEVKFDHTVLEVGTGSGYQAAILARLVRKVCTIEIVPALGEVAAKVLGDSVMTM